MLANAVSEPGRCKLMASFSGNAALGPQDEVFVQYVQANTPLNVISSGRINITDATTPEHTL